MNKKNITLFITLILFSSVAHTQDDTMTGSNKDTLGFGIGALIGGLLAGPPGAIIGAAGGTLFGDQAIKKDQSIVTLESELQNKNIELAYLQTKITEAQSEYAKSLYNVKLENKQTALTKLSKNISFSIYFRTGKADIDPTLHPHIHDLVSLIKDSPEIKIHLDAHADSRGDINYNMNLSQSRANAVETALRQSGLAQFRIQKHAYGESRARINEIDQEGYIFDRRVDIYLTLDTEV